MMQTYVMLFPYIQRVHVCADTRHPFLLGAHMQICPQGSCK